MPSTASKVTLVVSTVLTIGTVYFVHYKQIYDKRELHKGIEREEENKKLLNVARLQQQEAIAQLHRQNDK